MGTWASAVRPGHAGAPWGAHGLLDAGGAGQLGGTQGPPQAQQVRAGSQSSQRRLPDWAVHALYGAAPGRVWSSAAGLSHELAQGHHVESLAP